MEERILCAAIWYCDLDTSKTRPTNIDKGIVVAGRRHHNCISTMSELKGLRSVYSVVGKYVQGFITSTNKFVDRTEGLQIAIEANQVSKVRTSKRLYSEDLY